VLGDESGYTVSENQKMKLAAIEAMWETEAPPASFTVFGFPDVAERTTHMPSTSRGHGHHRHALARRRAARHQRLSTTRPSASKTAGSPTRRCSACDRTAVTRRRARTSMRTRPIWATRCCSSATWPIRPGHCRRRAARRRRHDTECAVAVLGIPHHGRLRHVFHRLFAWSFWLASKRRLDAKRWYLELALWSLPLPWLAAELGWIVAENGRQPWAIEGVLPTALGRLVGSSGQVLFSLIGFVTFYTALAVVDVVLMLKYTRRGPDGLGMWPRRRATRGRTMPSALDRASMRRRMQLQSTMPRESFWRVA
jgi:cytochrome d ubiquinol oxidase subunit I